MAVHGATPARREQPRIPDDQPFKLGLNLVRLGLAWAATWVVVVGIEAAVLGDRVFFVGLVLVSVGAALTLGIYLAANARRGATLAVGPDGVWVSAPVTGFGQIAPRFTAVFLPWSSIERIHLRRVLLDKRVCVRAGPGPRRGFSFRLDISDLQRWVYGTAFTASLTFGDRPEGDVVDALRTHGAVRTRMDL